MGKLIHQRGKFIFIKTVFTCKLAKRGVIFYFFLAGISSCLNFNMAAIIFTFRIKNLTADWNVQLIPGNYDLFRRDKWMSYFQVMK